MQDPVPNLGRRRTRIIVGAIALAILAGGTFAVLAVARYSPLEPGSQFGYPQDSVCGPESELGNDRYTCHVTYAHGAETSFSFSIRNGGFWGVTIVDLPILHSTAHELFHVTRATLSNVGVPDLDTQPFHAFALQSGDERLITLYGTFSDCEWFAANSGNAYDDVSVKYRVAWAKNEATVALPTRVEVILASDTDCPVARSRDRRGDDGRYGARRVG
jgi:hypothetical protein